MVWPTWGDNHEKVVLREVVSPERQKLGTRKHERDTRRMDIRRTLVSVDEAGKVVKASPQIHRDRREVSRKEIAIAQKKIRPTI